MNSSHSRALACLCLPCLVPNAWAQGTIEERLTRLEEENAELRQQMGAVGGQLEQFEFRDIMPPVGESVFGLGPGASKVYAKESGLSIGGYGEAIFSDFAGSKTSTADFVRNIIYVGYKFDDKWVFNSEIEIEHADEIFLEFAYLEYLQSDAFNFRAGLLLMPMGFVNEMHEPTTFRGPTRPETERRIIPSTWRENGAGILGGSGNFSYKLYVTSGLDAAGFDEDGLRGGRQKGSRALTEDVAVTARVDYSADCGLDFGLSGYYGDSGQGQAGLADATTSIFDAHLQYEYEGLRIRGLYAMAEVDDTVQVSATNGAVVGEEMDGWYIEAGYDVASAIDPESGHAVTPFVRYEQLDTHASVDPSLTADPMQDETITTMGIDWQPISNIVFKAAYQDFDQGTDALQLSLGYVF